MLCYLFIALAGAPGCSSARMPQPEPGWPATVKGYGVTIDDAKAEAVKEIAKTLMIKMHEYNPPLVTWRPTRDFIVRHVIQDSGTAGDDEVLEQLGKVKTWIYPIRAVDLVTLDAEAQRHQRRYERMQASIPFLGAYLLVLTGFAASFRAVSFWRRLR